MKLRAELEGKEHTVILETGSGHLSGSVADRSYEFKIRDLGLDEYLLEIGTSVYRFRVETGHETDEFTVHQRSRSYAVSIKDPKRLRSTQNDAAHAHGAARILAPMPGKLVRVLVEVGATVEAGTGLLIVEAMKMQNEMKSPRAGTVVSLRTDQGATVNAGDVLAIVE